MTNDDPMYVRQLEAALESAELEIKGLEGELREQDKTLHQLHEQMNPTHMGEPLSDEDAARWRWITRAARKRDLLIPANEGKKSIDAAIDGARFKQAQQDAEEGAAEKQAMYG